MDNLFINKRYFEYSPSRFEEWGTCNICNWVGYTYTHEKEECMLRLSRRVIELEQVVKDLKKSIKK